MTARIATLAYGALAYLAFVASLAYTTLFLAGVAVPKGVDDGPDAPVWLALVVDLTLMSLFAVQHSVMARPWFKRAWTTVVPPSMERSTYVLASSAVVALLLWQWRPLPHEVWSADPTWARLLLWAGYVAGWVVLLVSSFLIGHFDLFGIKQVVARWRATTYREGEFRTPGLYRYVRHPLMVGFLIAFWSTPDMSIGRLLFATVASAYIVVAVRFEEHDLRLQLGEPYTEYADRVPRFVPRLRPGLALAPRPRSHSAWEER
ncbi:methanethiol S-methyltransferase [Nocardioides sp. CER19]|uniref:methanethiol S-methyltransferase n=1 Tax=Nocardioides sp. CER19 TaxID=3038538 RepID=UPI0024495E3A|nr:methanethiol S-methyltransferase [Nocardioides sp. CER19]MDH2415092.1 isoprenylcysteine carboxylmethyltransferase family protein [Nocardioides sp. CER19]